MIIKSNKVLSVGLIAILGIVFLLSTFAMTPNQTTATSTVAASATNTELSTSTPTVTPTHTPTSPQLSSNDVQRALQPKFDELNSKMNEILDQTDSVATSSVFYNLVSNWIWAGIVAVLSALGLGNIVFSHKAKQDEKYDDLAKILRTGFMFMIIMAIIYLFIPILFIIAQSILQSVDRLQLATISQKLDRIENYLISPSQAIIDSSIQNYSSTEAILSNPLFLISISANLVLFLLFAIQRARSSMAASLPEIDLRGGLDKRILSAIVLVLILMLLPGLAETFILPFILPFLVVAFLEVVHSYDNIGIKKFVAEHYANIIMLAELGVWFNLFTTIRNYLNPFWETGKDALNLTPTSWINFIWQFVPLTLALILALRNGPNLIKQVKTSIISQIIETLNKMHI